MTMKDFPNLILDFHHSSAMCSMLPCSLQICRCILMSEKNKGTWETLHSHCTYDIDYTSKLRFN